MGEYVSSLQNGKIESIPKPLLPCKKEGCSGKVEKQVNGRRAASFTFGLLRCSQCGATYSSTEFTPVIATKLE